MSSFSMKVVSIVLVLVLVLSSSYELTTPDSSSNPTTGKPTTIQPNKATFKGIISANGTVVNGTYSNGTAVDGTDGRTTMMPTCKTPGKIISANGTMINSTDSRDSNTTDSNTTDSNSTDNSFTTMASTITTLSKVYYDLPWWKRDVIYEIYPITFKDSNGDGKGDLKGIISKLDYLSYLGIGAIWMTPIFTTPFADLGYDVADYKNIDSIFGSIYDLDKLISECHNRGIRVILDFVVGHVSTESDWFKMSENNIGKYKDYFIWNDGLLLANGTRVPPNNWLSYFSGSAWKWSSKRKQYFYHAFQYNQANLNHRNPEVTEEIRQALRFWLDKGVDGFRVDALAHAITAKNVYQNEPPSGKPGYAPTEFYSLKHIYTYGQPEVLNLTQEMMNVLNEYETNSKRSRFMILETFEEGKDRDRYYKTGAVPFNMNLTGGLEEIPETTGTYLEKSIFGYLSELPGDAWPNFVVDNHDVHRVPMKYGLEYMEAWNMLLLTLPGTATVYYGMEIGLVPPIVTWKQARDLHGRENKPDTYTQYTRDFQTTPMQWDNSKFAGFTTSNTSWLPVSDSYETVNVEAERTATNQSTLQLFVEMVRLRKEPVFLAGMTKPAFSDRNIFSFIRLYKSERVLVVINFGKSPAVASGLSQSSWVATESGEVLVRTSRLLYQKGEKVKLDELRLSPGEGVVLRLGKLSI